MGAPISHYFGAPLAGLGPELVEPRLRPKLGFIGLGVKPRDRAKARARGRARYKT